MKIKGSITKIKGSLKLKAVKKRQYNENKMQLKKGSIMKIKGSWV